jgi:hypothetical protein
VVQRPAVGEDVVDPPVPSSSSLPSISVVTDPGYYHLGRRGSIQNPNDPF